MSGLMNVLLCIDVIVPPVPFRSSIWGGDLLQWQCQISHEFVERNGGRGVCVHN